MNPPCPLLLYDPQQEGPMRKWTAAFVRNRKSHQPVAEFSHSLWLASHPFSSVLGGLF